MRTHPCPKCSRPFKQSGEVSVAGETLPVFQCDDCVVDFFGVPAAVAFCVDAQGRAFDPAEPDERLPPPSLN